MVIETCDMDLVRRIVTHPAIYPHISDDGSPAAGDYLPPEGPGIYYLTPISDDGEVAGVFILHAHNSVTCEIHTCILPGHRGHSSVRYGREALRWMIDNTPHQKIITHVPAYNRVALALARRVGMVEEGVNRASFLKRGRLYNQTLLGITQEEICQLQP